MMSFILMAHFPSSKCHPCGGARKAQRRNEETLQPTAYGHQGSKVWWSKSSRVPQLVVISRSLRL